jgi:hypothetical protein
MDIIKNAQVRQLLEQAESAVRMLGQVDPHGKRQVKHALSGIYEDIGKHIHALARQMATSEKADGTRDTSPISISELEDLTSEIEHTDEVANESALNLDISRTSNEWLQGPVESRFVSVEHVEKRLQQSLEQIHTALRDNPEETAWIYRLENLLDMLDVSEHLDSEAEVAVEASKLQWATSAMWEQWSNFPRTIQVALIGLLACRSHVLAEHAPDSLAPTIVIERLRNQQKRSGVPQVQGLQNNPSPEDESWTNDATLWWNILASCVSA